MKALPPWIILIGRGRISTVRNVTNDRNRYRCVSADFGVRPSRPRACELMAVICKAGSQYI